MTSERDFDRLARAWLELGPDEAPDRVVAAVLQAAETTPQVRRPIRWPIRRSLVMNRVPLVAGAATILAVVIGGGILIGQQNQTGVGVPTGSPSSTSAALTPSPSAVSSRVPAELQSFWVGAPRAVSGLSTNDRYRFSLTGSALAFPNDGLEDPELASTVAVVAADTLHLVTTDATARCLRGDIGRYRWSLSPGGTRLTLTLEGTDACPARGAALPGEWFRVACRNDGSGCLGQLEAGTFASQYIDPALPVGSEWLPNWGALTFTVPAGWANSIDWPGTYHLTPSAVYTQEAPSGPRDGLVNRISVWALPVAMGHRETCEESVEEVPRTVDGMMTYVTNVPTHVASAPQAISIDGHAGKWVDVRVDPSWATRCPEAGAAKLTFLSQLPGMEWDPGPLILAGEARHRLIFLDLGEDVVLVAIEAGDPARFDRLVADAMPIIETFRFR
jgi:hypothetical protein